MKFWILGLMVLLSTSLMAQRKAVNEGDLLLFRVGYAYQQPAADLSQRFGSSFSLNAGFDFITSKNLIFGIESQLFFGSNVKEDVLVNLRTEQGFIIANDRDPADLQLRERGLYFGGHVGKLFGMGKNPRSGIRVTLGAGWMQHQIRIQDDPFKQVAALNDAYRFGYDRLVNGLAFRQFVGYQILSMDGRLNFYTGIEIFEGLGKGRRDIQFDTRMPATENRFDLLIGLRLAWTLPFYMNRNAEDIYY